MHALPTNELVINISKWIGRALVLLVFFLLGAFFVEHTREWFIAPRPLAPPLKVWVGHGLHFLILAGLLVSLRWPPAGAALVVLSSLAFFGAFAGGKWPVFSLITCLPVLLLLFCWWRGKR